ncbi:MAG: IS200/IS605 family transposase [Pirellulales bacterium]
MSFLSLNVHLVWSTSGRRPLIKEAWQERLHAFLAGIVRHDRGQAVAIGGMPDHVHALVRIPSTITIANLMNHLKSNSSKWIHETFPEASDFRWQKEYAAFTVSASMVETVERYVRNQVEHHRIRSFQEELEELLRRHQVEFDPRYVWD